MAIKRYEWVPWPYIHRPGWRAPKRMPRKWKKRFKASIWFVFLKYGLPIVRPQGAW